MPIRDKGPKDAPITKVVFDDGKTKSKSQFHSLKTTKDLILLSIKGNDYCAGEYLAATVQAVVSNHQGQGKATFLIADEIYWHNLKPGPNVPLSAVDTARLKEEALALGEEYFNNNLKAFLTPLGVLPEDFAKNHAGLSVDDKIKSINNMAQKAGKNFQIMRWKTWMSQEGADKLPEIMPLYESVGGLKAALEESVSAFVKRHAKMNSDPTNAQNNLEELWAHRSRGYLTEESPAIMLLAAMLGYNFIAYPGEILPPFKATRDYFIVAKHVPRVENGLDIKETCAHDKHALHVANPAQLVNWLEINFQRYPVQKDVSPTFFKPQTAPAKKDEVAEIITQPSHNGSHLDLPDDSILYTILRGVKKGLEDNGKSSSKGQISLPRESLAEVFCGITQGVLRMEGIPMQQRIEMLGAIVDSVINKPEEDRIFSKIMC